jgi:hypothetical protein
MDEADLDRPGEPAVSDTWNRTLPCSITKTPRQDLAPEPPLCSGGATMNATGS